MHPRLSWPLVLRMGLGAAVIPALLACAGIPIPGADGDGDGATPTDAADDGVAGDPDGGEADPGDVDEDAAPKDPEALFATLDPNAPPPHDKPSLSCPSGTMPIRHKAKRFNVYCATGAGVRVGPYTEWSGGTLVIAATYADGKLEGPWTRWEKGEDGKLHKVEHQAYVAGVAEGDYALWDTQGRLLERGMMVKGQRDGRFVLRKVDGDALTTGGACYEGGTEVWTTADDAELVTKACATDAVAEGSPAEG